MVSQHDVLRKSDMSTKTHTTRMSPRETRGKVCVLMSGGADSAVMLWKVAQEAKAVPVYVRNGLHWEDTEIEYARRFVNSLDIDNYLKVLNLPVDDIYPETWWLTGEGVPDEDSDDEEVELPGRNILLLSKTSVFCSLNGINEIAHGTLGSNPFPDSTDDFFYRAEEMLSEGLDHEIKILRPFSDRTKEDVLREGYENDLRLDLTFSCIKPIDGNHCGECNKCGERHRYFEKAGIDDPTEYVNPF